MKTKNTIEVNGRRYDATTGALLGVSSAPSLPKDSGTANLFRERKKVTSTSEKVMVRVVTKPKSVTAAVPETKAQVVSVRRSAKKVSASVPELPKSHLYTERSTNHAKAHSPLVAIANASRQQLIERRKKQRSINHAKAHTPQVTDPLELRKPSEASRKHRLTGLHSPVNHTKPRSTQNSLTLVRSGVQRPAPSLRKQANPKGILRRALPNLVTVKSSVQTIDEVRLARAHSTARSPLIAHHAVSAKSVVQPMVTPLAVQPVPVKPEGETPTGAPVPQPTNKPDGPTDIFEQALANASHYADLGSHRALRKKRAKLRATSFAAGTLALLLIAAFATYQSTPGLQFKVASIRAGISTNMPNFAAAGFAYDSVHAGNGQLTIGFDNVSGNYQLTQTNTNMSGSDMIESIIPTTASSKGITSYQTLHADGTTVYRLDSTGATWVSNGKWNTIRGTSALSDSQIKSLVHNI